MSSKLKTWLLLGVIFIVGILTGSALTFGLAPHLMPLPGEQQMKRHWMAHLTQRLKLTGEQQANIQPILTDAETRIQALHHDEVDRGSQIIKAANDQIAAFLTPLQEVELQKMETEREKLFSGHLHPWGAPPQGPGGPPHDGPGKMPPPDGPGGNVLPPAGSPNAPRNAAPPVPQTS